MRVVRRQEGTGEGRGKLRHHLREAGGLTSSSTPSCRATALVQMEEALLLVISDDVVCFYTHRITLESGNDCRWRGPMLCSNAEPTTSTGVERRHRVMILVLPPVCVLLGCRRGGISGAIRPRPPLTRPLTQCGRRSRSRRLLHTWLPAAAVIFWLPSMS